MLFEAELVASLVMLPKDVSEPDGKNEACEEAKGADIEGEVDCGSNPVLVFESIGVLGGGKCSPKDPPVGGANL
jgi:hypothetical protein